MSPDDPRHGSKAGYKAGCREQCCRDGAARYMRGLEWDHMQGRRRSVSTRGARRRVEALACLGWTVVDVAERCGKTPAWLYEALKRDTVYTRTHAAIADAYDALCMRLPADTIWVTRTKLRAARNGWAPPLAWDDIDTDLGPHDGPVSAVVDDLVVERYLAAVDRSSLPRATDAERAEICRRWPDTGRTWNDLARLTGWKTERYRVLDRDREDAA